MSRDEVRNDGTGDETSDARRARRRDEKRGKDFAVKVANFTRPFLDSENGTKMGVTHLCLPCWTLCVLHTICVFKECCFQLFEEVRVPQTSSVPEQFVA